MNLQQHRGIADRFDVSQIEDPRWFPYDLDLASGLISFRHVEREDLSATPFLDRHWDISGFARKDVPAGALLAGRRPATLPKANVIWHIGYCCSTVIAKALETSACNTALCEPEILLRLAEARHRPARGVHPLALSELVFRLLARPFGEDGVVTIKAPPAAIATISEAARVTRGKMLFLYADCTSFILSAMRRSENRRRHIRALLAILVADTPPPFQWTAKDIARLTDLEVAAVVWHLQIAEFRRHCAAMGTRAASLDCDAFVDSPVETIAAIKRHFEIAARDDDEPFSPGTTLVSHDVKRPGESIDPLERRKVLQALDPLRREELESVVRSSYDLFRETHRGTPLPTPLIRLEKPYCP